MAAWCFLGFQNLCIASLYIFFGLAENLGELMVENIILGGKKLGYTVFEFMCVQGRLNEFGGSRQKL